MTAEEAPIGFPGFAGKQTRLVAVPDEFFLRLLPRLDSLGELKLLLHVFWVLTNRQVDQRYVTEDELFADPALLRSLRAGQSRPAVEVLRLAIDQAVDRNVLLRLTLRGEGTTIVRVFLNSPAGRQAFASVRVAEPPAGDGLAHIAAPAPTPMAPVAALDAPTIFALYEQNIALLTPLVADSMRAAASHYPEEWIRDAIREAAERNRRSWRYVQHILEAWEAEGRSDAAPERGPWTPTAASRFARGQYGRLVQS